VTTAIEPRRLATYVVLDADTLPAGRELPALAGAAVAGGATALQVRAKRAGGRELLELVTRVAGVAARSPREVLLLVNDRVDVAAAARLAGLPVHGAHIGQSDLPPAAARDVLGPDALLGLSIGSEAELRASALLPHGTVDYLGVSPVRSTPTKPDADDPVGSGGARRLAAAAHLPCVGIGGLTSEDAGWLRESGFAGIAVVSAVSMAADPAEATRAIAAAWSAAAGAVAR
jgi:thiamine-phosphate diphosphorylase